MLPAHGYPELKKRYSHLKGNFGTAWQNQQREFEDIPAPDPLHHQLHHAPARPATPTGYSPPRWSPIPACTHIGEGRDFSPVIAKALELGGYPEDTLHSGHERRLHGDHRFCPASPCCSHADEIVQAVRRAVQHPALLPGGRLRRHPAHPPLLHRVCPPDAARHRPADPGLRQVPSERPAARHRAGTACPASWTWASATTPTAPSGSHWRLADAFGCARQRPAPLAWCSAGSSRRRSAS